jgi:hypothetical protein
MTPRGLEDAGHFRGSLRGGRAHPGDADDLSQSWRPVSASITRNLTYCPSVRVYHNLFSEFGCPTIFFEISDNRLFNICFPSSTLSF